MPPSSEQVVESTSAATEAFAVEAKKLMEEAKTEVASRGLAIFVGVLVALVMLAKQLAVDFVLDLWIVVRSLDVVQRIFTFPPGLLAPFVNLVAMFRNNLPAIPLILDVFYTVTDFIQGMPDAVAMILVPPLLWGIALLLLTALFLMFLFHDKVLRESLIQFQPKHFKGVRRLACTWSHKIENSSIIANKVIFYILFQLCRFVFAAMGTFSIKILPVIGTCSRWLYELNMWVGIGFFVTMPMELDNDEFFHAHKVVFAKMEAMVERYKPRQTQKGGMSWCCGFGCCDELMLVPFFFFLLICVFSLVRILSESLLTLMALSLGFWNNARDIGKWVCGPIAVVLAVVFNSVIAAQGYNAYTMALVIGCIIGFVPLPEFMFGYDWEVTPMANTVGITEDMGKNERRKILSAHGRIRSIGWMIVPVVGPLLATLGMKLSCPPLFAGSDIFFLRYLLMFLRTVGLAWFPFYPNWKVFAALGFVQLLSIPADILSGARDILLAVEYGADIGMLKSWMPIIRALGAKKGQVGGFELQSVSNPLQGSLKQAAEQYSEELKESNAVHVAKLQADAAAAQMAQMAQMGPQMIGLDGKVVGQMMPGGTQVMGQMMAVPGQVMPQKIMPGALPTDWKETMQPPGGGGGNRV